MIRYIGREKYYPYWYHVAINDEQWDGCSFGSHDPKPIGFCPDDFEKFMAVQMEPGEVRKIKVENI